MKLQKKVQFGAVLELYLLRLPALFGFWGNMLNAVNIIDVIWEDKIMLLRFSTATSMAIMWQYLIVITWRTFFISAESSWRVGRHLGSDNWTLESLKSAYLFFVVVGPIGYWFSSIDTYYIIRYIIFRCLSDLK